MVDYYINTTDEFQNEKDSFYHCNEFLQNRDFEKLFSEIVDALLVFVILNKNIHLFEIDYFKVFLLVYLFDKI